MNGIHRNVRFARLAWAGLALLCLLLFLVAREQDRSALTVEVGAAERRARLYADTVLHDSLEARAVAAPISGEAYRKLHADLRDGLLDDPLVARVRLWAPDGTLLFSTAADERGKIGRLRVNEDPAITAASGGSVSSRLASAPLSTAANGGRAVETDLFETFVPLRVSDRTEVLGAIQIDQRYDAIRARITMPWELIGWVFAGVAILFGVLFVWSFRRRAVGTVVESATSGSGFDPPAERPVKRDGPARTRQRKRSEAPGHPEKAERSEAPDRPEEPVHAAGELTEIAASADQEALASLRVEHEASLVSARDEHDAALAAARTEHDEAVAGLGAELAGATAALGEAERRAAEAEHLAAEAERRATDLEVRLAAAERAAQDAAQEALVATATPPAPTASLEAQAIELLEARVMSAEDRAAEAERRLAELGLEGPPNHSNGHGTPTSEGSFVAATEPYALADDDPIAFGATNGHRDEIEEPDLDGPEQPEPSDELLVDDQPEGPPVSPISAEASELRARLARSAARKKRSLEP